MMKTNALSTGSLSFNYQEMNAQLELSERLPATSSSTTQAQQQTLSSLAQLSVSYELSEVSYSENHSEFAYDKRDLSLAMRASSSTDVNLREEKINIEMTFSAEMVGLTAADFKKNNGKPLELMFSFQQTDLNASYSMQSKTVKTLRKPEEILMQLATSLGDVLSKRGNKSVALALDKEALQVLFSDPKTKEIFGAVYALLEMINTMRQNDNPRDQYLILLSGKGKPYQDIQEKTKVEGLTTTFQLKITIMPPKTQNDGSIDLPAPTAAEDNNSSPPAIDVSR